MKTILIVDDNEDQHAIMHALLTHRGYSTLHARSVEDARALLGFVRPNLIVLDIWLKPGHGLDLLYSLATAGSTIPVVVCTADALAQFRYPGAVQVAAGWLLKPVFASNIFKVIEDAIGPP